MRGISSQAPAAEKHPRPHSSVLTGTLNDPKRSVCRGETSAASFEPECSRTDRSVRSLPVCRGKTAAASFEPCRGAQDQRESQAPAAEKQPRPHSSAEYYHRRTGQPLSTAEKQPRPHSSSWSMVRARLRGTVCRGENKPRALSSGKVKNVSWCRRPSLPRGNSRGLMRGSGRIIGLGMRQHKSAAEKQPRPHSSCGSGVLCMDPIIRLGRRNSRGLIRARRRGWRSRLV